MFIREIGASAAAGGWLIQLKPGLCLLTGLTTEEQPEVADLVASVVYGRTEGLTGWVEVDGARMSVSDWSQTVGQALDHLDVFVRASDLPGMTPGQQAVVAARRTRDEQPADAVDVAPIDEASSDSEAAELGATAAVGSAVGGGGEPVRPIASREELVASHAHAVRRAEAALAEAEATASRASAAGVAVDQLIDELTLARSRAGQERADLAARQDDIRSRLGRLVDVPGVVRPERVEAAAKRLRDGPDEQRSIQAAELAVRARAVATRRPSSAAPVPSARLVDHAREVLEAAKAGLLRAEPASLQVGAEDAAQLEAAHEAVAQAEARAGRRFARAAAGRRVEEAVAAEQAILDRIGVPTYGAYILRTMAVPPAADAAETSAAARRAMADAEAVWSELHGVEAQTGMSAEEAAVIAEAASFLGEEGWAAVERTAPGETLLAIERVLVDLADPGPLAAELSGELAAVGVHVDSHDRSGLLAEADRWLESAGDEAVRQRAVTEERAAGDIELASLREALAALDAVLAPDDRGHQETPFTGLEECRQLVDRIHALRAEEGARRNALAEAQRAADAAADAAARVIAEVAGAEEALRCHDAAAASKGEAPSEPAPAAPSEPVPAVLMDDEVPTPVSIADAEIYLLSRLARARASGPFGAVPIILVDPFAAVGVEEVKPIHDLLGRVAAAVQIIYLTEQPHIIRWAEDFGPERVTIVHPGAAADLAT